MRYQKNGTITRHHGYWVYAVKLPGESKRRMITLKAPGAKHGLAADRPREMAEKAAARVWEEATRELRHRHGERLVTIEDICTAYCNFAPTYYKREDGTLTKEVYNIRLSLRVLRQLFGTAAAAELTHADMLVVRDAIVRSGVARVTVNRQMSTIKRMFSWALDEALVSATIKAELTQVKALKRGRSIAPECPPVREVSDSAINAALAHMMPNTADMVRVHRLTGMRPGELCAMRWSLIDTSVEPWLYRPAQHKNAWRGELGQPRVILIGAKAREILRKHKTGDVPFSPMLAIQEWLQAKREARTSPFYACRDENYTRAKKGAQWKPGEFWTTDGYSKTIADACRRAGIEPFGSNRIRHTFATEVRRKFGLEACRAVLGHSLGATITDRYSFAAIEDETIEKAAPAVEALG